MYEDNTIAGIGDNWHAHSDLASEKIVETWIYW